MAFMNEVEDLGSPDAAIVRGSREFSAIICIGLGLLLGSYFPQAGNAEKAGKAGKMTWQASEKGFTYNLPKKQSERIYSVRLLLSFFGA